MKKLAILLLLSGSAQADLAGDVYAKPVHMIGLVGQAVTLTCNHGGYVKNTGTTEVKSNIEYSVCANDKNCSTRNFTWKFAAGQEWTHFDTKQVNQVYKYAGQYTFTCSTFVSGVGTTYETGTVQIG